LVYRSYYKAADFANCIDKYCREKGHDIFKSDTSLLPGDIYESVIMKEISNRDIFIIMITPAALESKNG
jgi:hypothetical protein